MVPLTLLLGVGLAYYMTRHTPPGSATTWAPSTQVELVEPTADGGLLSARLSQGHAGLLAAPEPTPPDATADEATDATDAKSDGTAVAVLDRPQGEDEDHGQRDDVTPRGPSDGE